ncbi:hypothetical protein RUND412_007396 [Rhizina undulata]
MSSYSAYTNAAKEAARKQEIEASCRNSEVYCTGPSEESDIGTIMGLNIVPGKDIERAVKGISSTARESYIRQWLGIEDPETFEAEAEAENSRSSPEGMDYEYCLPQTGLEDDRASLFSEISISRVWKNFPARTLRQIEEDYLENASEFSEIPLVLVLGNLMSMRENKEPEEEDLARAEIEEDILGRFSGVSPSCLWPDGPIGYPAMNSEAAELCELGQARRDQRYLLTAAGEETDNRPGAPQMN